AERLRLLEIRDVSRVQDVEATVRHHDALAARLRLANELDELVGRDEPASSAAAPMQREPELGAAHGRDAEFPDDEPRAEVRELRRLLERQARAERGRHQRDHRVAGTGDVEDLARLRVEDIPGTVPWKERHAALAASHEQTVEIELGAKRFALRVELVLAAPRPSDRAELALVGREQGGTAIAAEVEPLRVDEHRNPPLLARS